MKFRLISVLCCVVISVHEVLAEGDNEIKKGTFPFMAYILYSDESVMKSAAGRFLRGAVLVKPDWLVTASFGPAMMNQLTEGFPRKTLLARLGSVAIDPLFTLSDDEYEQEREIIQIVSPQNRSATQWWHTDISLLKTLLPFNITAAVNTATLLTDKSIKNTDCFFLAYARRTSNITEDRVLMQLYVDIMPDSPKECQPYYHETMICAKDNAEANKGKTYDGEFCEGSHGGPLICDNNVAGIQTYVDNNCKSPYIYQQLSMWNNFITCGIEDKCNEEGCANVCTVTNKDEIILFNRSIEIPTSKLVSHISSSVSTI
ncbi:hypothetical protein ACJJTC_017753 [Scirpophaga incertulas]